jgi:hypothetical protein
MSAAVRSRHELTESRAGAVSARARKGAAYRLSVAGRVILAAIGGYVIAALSAATLALVLPLPKAEAVSAGTLASFAILVAAAIWTFCARSLGHAALTLGLLAMLLLGSLWLAGGFSIGTHA